MKKIIAWNELKDRQPAPALVANVDLVVIRADDKVSVLYGRCLIAARSWRTATSTGTT